MVSSPENASFVSEFIKDETTGELSRPSLETLTIIAYRGPVAKLDLDRIRGVNCSLILRNLLLRGLVEVYEDKERGESIYNVSFDFLRFLGVNKVSELSDYERLHSDNTIDNVLNKEENEKYRVALFNGANMSFKPEITAEDLFKNIIRNKDKYGELRYIDINDAETMLKGTLGASMSGMLTKAIYSIGEQDNKKIENSVKIKTGIYKNSEKNC